MSPDKFEKLLGDLRSLKFSEDENRTDYSITREELISIIKVIINNIDEDLSTEIISESSDLIVTKENIVIRKLKNAKMALLDLDKSITHPVFKASSSKKGASRDYIQSEEEKTIAQSTEIYHRQHNHKKKSTTYVDVARRLNKSGYKLNEESLTVGKLASLDHRVYPRPPKKAKK